MREILYIGDEENAFDNGKESLLSIELPALETVAGQITVNSEKVGRICFSALSEAMSSIRKRKGISMRFPCRF